MKKWIKILLAAILIIVGVIIMLELTATYRPSNIINQKAPVKTLQSIRINAPSSKVYAMFTNVNAWPKWQKEITGARLVGPLAPGSVIKWSTAGMNIQSTLQTVETNQKIGWCGKAFGAYAIHSWQFRQHEGYTEVIVNESMEGWVVSLLQGYFQQELQVATRNWLVALRQQAEKS